MQIPISGQCPCGAVRYECSAEPLAMYNCHCQACQRTSGAPYSSLLVMRSDAVTIHGSPMRYSVPVKDGSEHMLSEFCGSCGAPLFARSDVKPDILLIKAPTLANVTMFKPVADIWTVSMQPWVGMDTHIPKVYQSPPLLQKETVAAL